MGNFYDNIEIDIEEAHRLLDNDVINCSTTKYYLKYIDYLLYKKNIYRNFIDAGIIRGWFEEFSDYWFYALKGRLIRFHDFFYLYTLYRSKFKSVELAKNYTEREFLYSWQRYENVYLTFGYAYKYALDPFSYLEFSPYIKEKKRGHILEYGCGVAPITASMVKSRCTNYKFTIADIKNFTFHYAKYRLKQFNVKSLNIDPFLNPQFEENYDIIFIKEVFEHLPNPLDIVRVLTESLNSKGYLIFDYVLSTGGGQDTNEGITQRSSVLKYIETNFKLIKGVINYASSMGTTIVQKL
jgi:SAM-dependent methyltransferase